MTWLAGIFRALGDIAAFGLELLLHPLRGVSAGERAVFIILVCGGLGATVILGQVAARPDLRVPVRMSQSRPERTEAAVSIPIEQIDFNPGRDLVRVYDDRVWWESENDDHTRDIEDDHLMHWSMEEPFRRLVELVVKEGGLLKVQDIYRAEGIHKEFSLHKQGRAIDLTSENMSLGRLAALTYAAGFDWVLLERGGGHHVHASINPKNRRRLQ
jgi:hypothetical protein